MSSQQLIANELLAFIQNAIDTMDEVSILQICKSSFKEDEDIITLLKETDSDDVPSFVVKELHKLPPVMFDHVDVTRLLNDINYLKASLAEVVSKLEDE